MTEIKGLVSVSIPFYNAERYIAETIESVLAQTYTQWELLLVDDGSKDRSSEIARSYVAKLPGKVIYLEHPEHQNLGVNAARNLGATRGRGEFLAFLDSDDIWLPPKLQDNVALMNAHPEAGLVYGLTEWWYDWNPDQSGRRENHVPSLAPGEELYLPPVLLAKSYPLGEYGAPCPSSFLVRRTAFDRVGGFDGCFSPKTYQLYEDIAFLAKIYLNVPVFVSSLCLDKNRCNRHSMTQKIAGTSDEDEARRFFFNWLKNHLRQKKVVEPKIWRAVHKESWFYSLPIPGSQVKLIRRIQNKIARTLHPEAPQS